MCVLHCETSKCTSSKLAVVLVALAEAVYHLEQTAVVNHFAAEHCLEMNSTLLCVAYSAASTPTAASASWMAVQ